MAGPISTTGPRFHRIHSVLLVLVSTLLTLSSAAVLIAAEQSSDDAKLLEQVISDLEAAQASITNFSVATDYVKRQQFGLPVDEPVEIKLKMTAVISKDGHVRSETDGQQINIEPDGKSVRLFSGHWLCLYRHKEVKAMPAGKCHHLTWYEGKLMENRIDGNPSWHGVDPREFTTHYMRRPITAHLREPGVEITERVRWDGHDVVILESKPLGTDVQRRYRFWIDPKRRAVVRRTIVIQYQPDQPWQEYTRIVCRDYREIVPGIWLPTRVRYESVDVDGQLSPEKLAWSFEGINREWKVNQDLPDDTFDFVKKRDTPPNDVLPPE